MTAPAQNPPVILSAVKAVMDQVTYVPKAGQYDGGKSGSYKFRKFEDTAAALGDAFRQHGIFVQSEVTERVVGEVDRKPYNTGSGYTLWTQVFVTVRYTFTSLADGSTLSAEAIGEGKDSSDKASAKAMTMAMKSALTQSFMIATDEKDPDAERPGDYSEPVGRGQFDPNEAARNRQQNQRQQATEAGVQAPSPTGSREEKVAAHVTWVAQELKNPELDLERLAYIHTLTAGRGLLGVDAGGVALELRIKAEMARWGINPNATMPTPEQARAWIKQQDESLGS